MQAVWPATFVEDGILAQNVATLRRTLQNPNWIETVRNAATVSSRL